MGKFTLKKSLKRYTANVLNFLLLFSLIVPNVLSPAIVIAQDLDIEQEESITEIPTIPIDESEDILEEGISTSTFEEGIYTVSLVEEKEYVYPEDDRVRIRFTSITEEGDLTIKKVILTEEEKLSLNTTDEYAWDFTSTMSNGSFTYDLVLPNNQGEEIEVKYSEDGSTYSPIDEVLVNEGIVKISGLDHFTTFVVVTGAAGSTTEDPVASHNMPYNFNITGCQEVLPPDKTPPSNKIKNILVSRDNGSTYSESEFINKGDFVKVQVEAIDDLSGIKNVQFRIQDKVSGAYVAPIGYINTTISENIYEYTFQVPTDGKYINTHGPISQIFEQISVWARATDLAGNYNHGTTDYITYDNTQPTISMPKMLVSEDGINFTERNYVKPGDTIKIQAIASDSSSGIESVEFRITDKDTNEYIAPRTFVETAVNSEGLYEFIFSIPNDLKYINTHNPISQEPFQLSYFVRSHDNAGNYAHGQKDFFTLDTTAPSQPTGLMRKDLEGTVYQCGDIAQLQTLIPDWDDNTEADFSHYEYTSFHPNGSIGINEQKLNSSEFLHNWVPTTEGIYGYAVRAVDLAGNKSPWSLSGKTLEGSCQITYDSTGPVAPSIVFPSEGQYFNSTPILNDWTEVSDPSGIKEYRIEYIYDDGHTFSGGPYRTTTSSQRNHTPSLSEQGGVTIRVQAIDKVGNEGAWSNPVHYYYDKTGPEILFGGLRYINSTTTVDTSNIYTNDNTPIIFFTASDTLGTVVEASVNGYSATYDGTYWVAEITNPLPEGINSLSIKAKDNAGNESQITHDIFVDTKAPFAQYTYYKDGEEILSSTAYVQEVSQLSFLGQYMDDDPSSGILKDSYVIFDSNLLGTARTSKAYCGWRGTGNTVKIPYTEKVLFTNCEPTLPDGQYFMYHQVYDNAVRKDIPTITQFRDVKGLHFVVDTIAPVVEITSPSENDSLSGEVIIQGNVKDLNLSHYNISIYDGDADVNDFSKRLLQNTEYTTEFDTKNLLTWDTTEFDNGEYQIRLAARDLAGNRDDDTSIQVIKVIVDNTPPTTEQPTQNEGEVQGVTTGSNTTTNSPTLAKKVTTFIADILGVGGEGDVLALEEEEETLEDDEEVKGSQTCDNPSTISGYIYIDSNENGEKDEKERVFPEISIRIYTITEGMEETVKQIVSDENGYWETTLCSGDYYISVDDSKLPNNYVLEEDTLGVQVEEDKDSTLNFEVLDERNFLQKYWPWILLAVGILGSIGIVTLDTRRKKEYI